QSGEEDDELLDGVLLYPVIALEHWVTGRCRRLHAVTLAGLSGQKHDRDIFDERESSDERDKGHASILSFGRRCYHRSDRIATIGPMIGCGPLGLQDPPSVGCGERPAALECGA